MCVCRDHRIKDFAESNINTSKSQRQFSMTLILAEARSSVGVALTYDGTIFLAGRNDIFLLMMASRGWPCHLAKRTDYTTILISLKLSSQTMPESR